MARLVILMFALFAVALANQRPSRPPTTPPPAVKQYQLTTSGSCGAKLNLICQEGKLPAGKALGSVKLSSSVSSGGKSSVDIRLQEITSLGASRN